MATKQNQLALFTFTQPTLAPGMKLGQKFGEDGETVVSMTLALGKRKDVAKELNLAGKDNADKLNKELLSLSDGLKEVALGEFMKLGASNDWTGGRFTIRQSKSGKKTATMSLVTANRESRTIGEDKLVEALSRLTEDQQIALMERAEMLKRDAINVSTIEAGAAAPAA